MNYREDINVTKQYKEKYADGFARIIAERQREATAVREEYVKDIFNDPERYRRDFKAMLGWPLVGHSEASLPSYTEEKISEEDGYSVYRMSFDVLNGLTLTGLFFRVDGDSKRPLVIVQHGGLGTPELISGIYGSTSNYNGMLERVIKHGVHAFAPQLLLWDEKKYDVKYDRKSVDARLKRVGSSISAVEIYAIMRVIDHFEAQEYVSRFGMVGMSYGGFYALFTAAADTRIKSTVSCSFFNTRDEAGWPDWTWQESAEKFDDAEIACLVYPRKLRIEMGSNDRLFKYEYTEESFDRLRKLCKEKGCDWAELMIFDGNHEFCKDDAHINALISDLKNG